MRQEAKQLPARRILVMRYRFIGDTILTVPFLRNLRLAYPDARIDVLVGPQSGEVLQGCPYIDELIVFDTTRFHRYDSAGGRPRSFWSYALALRRRRYDMAFVLKRSFSSAFLARAIGARYRIGYNTEGRGFLLTHRVPWKANQHEVESLLDALRAVAVPIHDDCLEAWVSEEERQSIRNLVPELDEALPRVLVHAAAAHPDKMYPLNNWACLIERLNREKQCLYFFTGATADYPLYEELERLSGVKGVNLAGRLSLRQSLALYEHMQLAVCVDSGPAHLCAAAKVPTLALFGPTDPVRWAPWGDLGTSVFDASLACRPCNYKKSCNDRRQCLTELAPEAVAAKALELMAKASPAV